MFSISSRGDLPYLPSFPTRRSSDLADGAIDLEEERRLCYVGLTRARERLVLTRAMHRVKRGKPIPRTPSRDRKSTRLNSSHVSISYAVFCLKKKKKTSKTSNHQTQS